MTGNGTGINWPEVKSRLRESQLRFERSLDGDPQQLETVFRRRAAQLAERGAAPRTATPARPVLAFALGDERYGIELADLAEVLPFARCTPVPGAPPELLGVINLRGAVRSVLDLSRLLSLPGAESPAGGYVLVLRKHGRQVGLRVDLVERVQPVALAELAVIGEAGVDPSTRFLRGLAPDRLRLLSTEAILRHPLLGGAEGGDKEPARSRVA